MPKICYQISVYRSVLSVYWHFDVKQLNKLNMAFLLITTRYNDFANGKHIDLTIKHVNILLDE